MFATLFVLGPLYTSLIILTLLTIYYAARKAYVTRQVLATGGVRSPVLATNPFFGLRFFIKAGYSQVTNRLLDYYDWQYSFATPQCPNCVELSFTGRLRFLMTREPEHIKAVLTSKFADFGKGQQFHDAWHPFLGDSIFTTDGALWHNSRSLIRPMFVKDKVRDLHLFDRWTRKLISKLPPSGQTVDISDLFYRMTLDVTTDYLLGAGVNSLDDPKHSFAAAFNEVQRIQMMITILAPLNALIPKWRYNAGIRVLEAFMAPFIQQTLSLSEEELDKLSKSDKNYTFLHAIARSTRDPKVIRDQIMAVLIAGRDTTAATLSWTIYELSAYPATVRKLRAEILSTVGPTRTPTYEHLKNMPYLTHTLNETLRLYPAVPYNIRAALEDTTLPSGVPGQPDIGVRKNDVVVYSSLAMQRRKDLYPAVSEKFADPAVFSPERWESWTPRPWTYIPFNGGPRICVGQNFAMTEMAFARELP
ncbi:cytochrome P450 [Coniochaeta sp. 2T2.1]|nr:cytochrome P450 [Coniochaeta sp. 2T2.1]